MLDNRLRPATQPPRNIYGLLDHMREHPSMWLRRQSLVEIESILHGYSASLKSHRIRESGTEFNRRVSDYLEQRCGWSLCRGWACAIREHSSSSKRAFDRFFDLLDEFRKTHA